MDSILGIQEENEAHVIPAFSDLAFIRVKGKKSEKKI